MIWDGVDVRALWAIGFGTLSIKEDAHSDSLDNSPSSLPLFATRAIFINKCL